MKTFHLDQQPKITSGFKEPEGYFEGLENKINQRIVEVIPLYRQRKTWIWSAAAVLIIALSLPVVNFINSSNNEIDKATLENYLIDHAELTNEDIVELMNDQEVEKIRIDMEIEDRELEDALSGSNAIEDYLVN